MSVQAAREERPTCTDGAYSARVEWLFVVVPAVAFGALVGWLARAGVAARVAGAAPERRLWRDATTGNGGQPTERGPDERVEMNHEVSDAGVADVLAVLGDIAIVIDSSDAVVMHSPSAAPLGLVRDANLAHAALREVVRGVRRDQVIREVELEVPRGPIGEGTLALDVRVAPLGARHVLLLVEDRTQARRVEEVRRDFMANVSHELKTPVGGISLLAEAIADAADDPEAVARFAGRIRAESQRLTTLVYEIVELSRLQAQESGAQMSLVDVGAVARDAIEGTRTVAEARNIEFVEVLDPQTLVYGDPGLLRTAIANLLTNAVNYSTERTRVAVSARNRGFVVEVAVSDQGQGIPAAELDRIFERFYRIDAARSRATGGTGLGLAIVKHICANHGGEVTVWSQEGHGSTFTIRLPAASHGPVPGAQAESESPEEAEPELPVRPDDRTDPLTRSQRPKPTSTPSSRARSVGEPGELSGVSGVRTPSER